ncbi:uncharacterized protein LOC111710902 isoform X1 [Eurytemora carolleeae]|uniref:uncharacterized protein LOC111710902 isoform X1 n=2 Tax=Eurytemora carolleeae TaxID=1294199 RepID=UPI000C77A5B9|nr:uncharacterized protein LOC111710902 isoform X1 [Eurytemora carolleeae]|eukprot:XP_023340860.1 uncharacterized protein LOC111710902 isoform X1 [Eurytemora affinis]
MRRRTVVNSFSTTDMVNRRRLDSVGSSMSGSLSSSMISSTTSSQTSTRSLNNTMTSVSTNLDILEENTLAMGVCVQVDIPDGRLSPDGGLKQSRTVLRIEPLDGEPSLFNVKLSTSHYAFSQKRSTTTRTISSFYTLASILKSQHPYVSIPSLPVRPLFYLYNPLGRAEQLTSWLSQVLVDRQLLSNRALHLFLQTVLSIERIVENAYGRHDDQVDPCILVDTRKNRKEGFHGIFGNSFVEDDEALLEEHS